MEHSISDLFDTKHLDHYGVEIRFYNIYRAVSLRVGFGQWHLGNRKHFRCTDGVWSQFLNCPIHRLLRHADARFSPLVTGCMCSLYRCPDILLWIAKCFLLYGGLDFRGTAAMSHPPIAALSTGVPSDVPERPVCGCGRKHQGIRSTPLKDRSVQPLCPPALASRFRSMLSAFTSISPNARIKR